MRDGDGGFGLRAAPGAAGWLDVEPPGRAGVAAGRVAGIGAGAVEAGRLVARAGCVAAALGPGLASAGTTGGFRPPTITGFGGGDGLVVTRSSWAHPVRISLTKALCCVDSIGAKNSSSR